MKFAKLQATPQANHSARQIRIQFHLIRVFTLEELRRNRAAFLLPAILYLTTLIYTMIRGTARQSVEATWAIIIGAALLAMVYGLQCYSNETDQRTLDFIITRPLSPYLIMSVKYFLSLAVLLGWCFAFFSSFQLQLIHLPLMKEMGPEWIFLIILMIHAISCFSGLLSQGLERLFAVTVMTGLLAFATYHIWSISFTLMKANNFVFDILPYQLQFINNIFPVYLSLLGLATPFIGTAWLLRNRIPLHRFSPAKWLTGLWIGTYLITILAQAIFAPPLWPDVSVKYADWNERTGIVTCGPKEEQWAFFKAPKGRLIKSQISLAKLGHKKHEFYNGWNIKNVRFSPDGSQIVFSESGQLKISSIKKKNIISIGLGNLAVWSQDATRLICSQTIGREPFSRLYVFNVRTHSQKEIILPDKMNISAMYWNSGADQLFLFGQKEEVHCFNLRTGKIREFSASAKRNQPLNYYSIIPPSVSYNQETNCLVWGQTFEDEVRIFQLNPQTGVISLIENVVNKRIKTASPVIINNEFKAFLWQRMDGTFVYQATTFYSNKGAIDDDD